MFICHAPGSGLECHPCKDRVGNLPLGVIATFGKQSPNSEETASQGSLRPLLSGNARSDTEVRGLLRTRSARLAMTPWLERTVRVREVPSSNLEGR